MSDDTGVTDVTTDAAGIDAGDAESIEKQAFLDRLSKEGDKRKAAEQKASELEKRLAAVEAAAQERETAGLPELERERKRAEALEKRIAEAEQRAAESEAKVARTQREQWVAQAAAAQNFANPARAARLIDDLDSIEDADAAERAVKRLARSDSYLIKSDDSAQPKIGRVLENGKTVSTTTDDSLTKEAQAMADELKKLIRR